MILSVKLWIVFIKIIKPSLTNKKSTRCWNLWQFWHSRQRRDFKKLKMKSWGFARLKYVLAYLPKFGEEKFHGFNAWFFVMSQTCPLKFLTLIVSLTCLKWKACPITGSLSKIKLMKFFSLAFGATIFWLWNCSLVRLFPTEIFVMT